MIKRTYVTLVKEVSLDEYREAHRELFPERIDETLCEILDSLPLYREACPINKATRIKIYELVKKAYKSGARKFSIQYVYDSDNCLVAWILVQE